MERSHGGEVPEAMLRTAYVGILDPTTRTHQTNFQGKATKPEILKQEILRFVSNAVVDNSTMQVGRIGEVGEASVSAGNTGSSGQWAEGSSEWEWYEDLNAITPQKGGWNFAKGGYWNYSKGKRKRKGKGKRKRKRR